MPGRGQSSTPVTVAVIQHAIADKASNPVAELIRQTKTRRTLRCPDADSAKALIMVPLDGSALPDAQTVHDTVDALAELGWSSVAVAGRLMQRDLDLGLDDVETVLLEAGYRGTTQGGRPYERVDVSERAVASPCPDTSLLAGQPVSAEWVQAGLRVVVSRWSEDAEDLFRAGVSAMLACADAVRGATTADIAADIATHLPPAFSIVEVSGLDSTAFVGSASVLLTDVVTAVLCGVDPAASRVVHGPLVSLGLPVGYRMVGDVEALAPRRTETRVVSDALRALSERLPGAGRTMRILMSGDDTADDADTDEVLSWLHRTLGPLIQSESPTKPFAVGALGYGIGGLAESVAAWRTNFSKDDVPRLTVPLGFDAGQYRRSDYEAIPGYIAGFTTLLDAAHEDDSFLRWCYFDESVLFTVHRVVNARYVEFIDRVDVSAGISMMADYLGGRRVGVSHDDRGRRSCRPNATSTCPSRTTWPSGAVSPSMCARSN